ncbi:MAG: ATP-binding cassette domain-containing protein [Arcobacteraceae bacterium]
MLKIDIQKKDFKEKNILNSIQIDVKQSELISIIGPSGCGKTTILKLISSLDENYEGKITYKGEKNIDNLGFIFQDPRLLPWLTVKENIMLVSNNKDEQKVESLLEEVGLENYSDAYINTLSGGMKRRVSIVRAFVNNPEVLLLDEPFISLDHPTAQVLRKLFFKFYKEYSPIALFVTHDIHEALAVSNRILFLSKSPTNIIFEYKNIPSFDDKIILEKKEKILLEYPNILSGII